MKRRTMLGATAALGLGSSLGRPASAQHRSGLLGALQGGGLVIYFRHSLTLRSGQPDTDLSTCEGQRNLTPAGRALAEEIGRTIRARAIPIGAVEASPYCRCVDTASLAFGRVAVAAFLETNGDLDDAAEQQRLTTLAQQLQQLPRGGNRVLVAHGNNLAGLQAHHGYPALRIAEAEAVVLEPRPGGARVLGRVAPEHWAGLA